MNDIGNFLDGHKLLTGSLFRSKHFIGISMICLASIVLTIYILYRHWHTLSGIDVVVVGGFLGLHSFYQWWRAMRYYSEIQILYSIGSRDEEGKQSPLDDALRVAVGGITDILFYSLGMIFIALGMIGGLLGRIDGIRW